MRVAAPSLLLRIALAALVALLSLFASRSAQAEAGPEVPLLEIRGVINPLTARYLSRELVEAARQKTPLVLVEIDTPVNPTGQARQLATEGIYARTRNPMYLGALVGFVGLGLALRSTWLLLAVPAMAVALHILAISREEAYLERVFGEEYRHFRSRVRRWI